MTTHERIIWNIKFFWLFDISYSLIKIKITYNYVTCLHNSQILLYTEITCPTSLGIPYTCWEYKTNKWTQEKKKKDSGKVDKKKV